MDDFDELLSSADDMVDLDGNPIKKQEEELQEVLPAPEDEPVEEEVLVEDEVVEEEVVEDEVADEVVINEAEEEVEEETEEENEEEVEEEVEEEAEEELIEDEVIDEPIDEVIEEETIEEPVEEVAEEPAEEIAEEIVEEPAEEEVIEEENLTETIIEEIQESVVARRQKPAAREHDADTEAENKPNGDDDDGRIIYKEIGTVMHESMIPYSEFVIMDRALPRVEDGLKPVQRRILYAMHEMGLTPDKPFRKSAGIVGECLGKFHPHGDTSVYDAMVRLAQPFNLNMPLVLGQGNFGSEDGDPAAAMRYTEAKLEPLAMELLRDIDKETVPFSLTFDDRNTEPDILPGRYPNLLTNGATGIAVGLATNIAPHNLAEVIDAHIAFIDNPSITLAQVMKLIKGPDFPTGGFVMCGEELLQAYKTGKGRVTMRGKVHIEGEGNDRRNIVITEVPYQVNKVTLQKNIADLREAKKGALSGIQEIRDESDRKGCRIVIRVKKEFDAKEICQLLFKHTSLQTNFNINMVAIANGKPKLMGLMELISYYVNFQREVIYKRSVFDLENAKEKAHILEGLLIAIRAIDEVVKIIKTSKNTGEAKDRLRKKFELSDRQAQAILDLRLARLTSLEVFKLEQELAELRALIDKLSAIISSKKRQFEVVKEELLEIKRKYKIERRSRIIKDLEEAVITADDDERPVEDGIIVITADGMIKRVTPKNFSMSNTAFAAGMGLNDTNIEIISAATNKLLYIFTNLGNCYKTFAGDIPECKLRDKGTNFRTMFKEAGESERPVTMYALDMDVTEMDDAAKAELGDLVWMTRYGMVKRSTWIDSCGIQKGVFPCYKLRDDVPDVVERVKPLKKGKHLVFLGSGGHVLHCPTTDVPVQGRIAAGVKGISLGADEYSACSCTAKNNGFLVAVTNKGGVKKTALKDIKPLGRYRKGDRFGQYVAGETVVFGMAAKGDEDLVVLLDNGSVIFMPIEKVSATDRIKPYKAISGIGKSKVVAAYLHLRKKR
jgi:DNA gyrase subunit A